MNDISMQEAAKAWGEGKDVEWSNEYQFGGAWQPINTHGFYFNTSVKYRLKPEVTTSLSVKKLRKAYYDVFGLPDLRGDSGPCEPFNKALRAVADTAIKQYIKENPK